MQLKRKVLGLALAGAMAGLLTGCGSDSSDAPAASTKNVIFFLGDGMGIPSLTAARIYAVGEDGELTIDTLPETAFVRTFSEDAQVTDSAPSMAAYMTGVKMRNEVISMQTGTVAVSPTSDLTSNCASNAANADKKPVDTLLELAKAKGMGTGVVTTTRVTHATPATTYAHVCHRDAENDIAAQLVPGGAGTGLAAYNSKLGQGVDVVLGGGRQFFTPKADGGKRADGRNLVNEMKTQGYTYVSKGSELAGVDASKTGKLFGLFNNSHMNYDLDRSKNSIDEPSLADMATKALDVLANKKKPFFLMVEGGRIDHALHDSNAKRALVDAVAFDNAIKAVIAKVRLVDPELKNTLIVVTADHDHTIVLNGYAARTGKTTASQAGVLGLVKDYSTGQPALDVNDKPYTIIGFGNGYNRPDNDRKDVVLDDAAASGDDYHQEVVIPTGAIGNETHGGTDVFLGAIGAGADLFHGSLENKDVFGLVRQASGL